MDKSRRTKLGAMQAMGLVILLTIFPAGADVHYVDLNSTNPVPPFTDWSIAANLIQDGVNAAGSGDTVRIAPGDYYYQQVVVAFKNNITLAGEPGVVIHAFPGMLESLSSYGWLWYPLVALYRSSDVVLSGLTIAGEHLADLYSRSSDGTLPSRLLGVYLLQSGATVTNCTLKGFRASNLETSTDANALQAFNPVQTGASPVNVGVVDSTFLDNQSSILLRGDPSSVAKAQLLRVTATIKGNSITGLGPLSIFAAGIWVVNGVAGDVIGNTISEYAGTARMLSAGIAAYDAAAQLPNGHGRFIPLQPLNFEGNTFTNNGQHLMIIGGNDSRVVNNKFLGSVEGAFAWGGLCLSGTNILVSNNDFSDMPTGVLLVGDESWNGWPSLPPAAMPSLLDNWFCNVPAPIQFNPVLVPNVHEQGTETNYPFTPRFQSFAKPGTGRPRALLRGWHGDTVSLESSTNLVDWAPVHTHLMELPTHECRDMNTGVSPQQFYRASRL